MTAGDLKTTCSCMQTICAEACFDVQARVKEVHRFPKPLPVDRVLDILPRKPNTAGI